METADTYIEVVDFEEFEKVHAHQLETNAEMFAEDHVVVQMNHVHDVFRVILLQELQDLELHSGLVVVLFLIFDDLDRNVDFVLVVEALKRGAERALA